MLQIYQLTDPQIEKSLEGLPDEVSDAVIESPLMGQITHGVDHVNFSCYRSIKW